jgi:hypothetical protein
MQNYTDVGTQTVLAKRAKDQLDKGKTCSSDAASSGFERFMPILARQNYIGTDTPNGTDKRSKGSTGGSFRGTIEIQAAVIRHLEESKNAQWHLDYPEAGLIYLNAMLVRSQELLHR